MRPIKRQRKGSKGREKGMGEGRGGCDEAVNEKKEEEVKWGNLQMKSRPGPRLQLPLQK